MNRVVNEMLGWIGRHRTGLCAILWFAACVWWLYPFADVSKSPAFNSDSAVVLSMATQRVPASESIFYWGTARSGSILVPLASALGSLLSEQQLIKFFSIGAACFAALACTVFIVAADSGNNGVARIAVVPAAIFLLGANFAAPPSFISLSWLMTDIASRPELPCLLTVLCWLGIRLGQGERVGRRAFLNGRFLCYVLLACTAAWVSDFGLVATLLVAVVLTALAALRRNRLPVELFVGFAVATVSLHFLRQLSPHGAAQTKTLLRIVNEGSFRALFGPAIANIVSHLNWSTWIAIGMIIGILAIWSLLNHKTAAQWSVSPAYLQAILCLALGLAEFVTALANQWVYDNGVFPRYFTPGVVLLCVAATQAAVFLVTQSTVSGWERREAFVAWLVIIVLLFPALLSTRKVLSTRRNLAQTRHSIQYDNSDMLYRAGARAVVGPYWKAYVSVLAHPVKMKATPRDGDEDRSTANTMNCLRARNIVAVDETPGALVSRMKLRGFELEQANIFPAQKLVDETYYKFYRNTGRLTIDARYPPTLLYLSKGWHFGERDATGAWVWSNGKSAELSIPLRPLTAYRMQIEAFTFPAQNGRSQTSSLRLAGRPVATLQFDADGALLTREVEFATGAAGQSPLEIASELALPESSVNRNTANPRVLAVAVRWISFEPLDPPS